LSSASRPPSARKRQQSVRAAEAAKSNPASDEDALGDDSDFNSSASDSDNDSDGDAADVDDENRIAAAQVTVVKDSERGRYVRKNAAEVFCYAHCPTPFADSADGSYDGVMIFCDGPCDRWYVRRLYHFLASLLCTFSHVVLLPFRYHGMCADPRVLEPLDKRDSWYCSELCRNAVSAIDAARAAAAAGPDKLPLRELIPDMTTKRCKHELELRGLSGDGRLADLRSRLVEWLDGVGRGEQRLRTQLEREQEWAHMTVKELRAQIQNRSILLPVGLQLARMDAAALRSLLALLTSTPREFVVDSLSLGWDAPPAGFVLSSLPASPVAAGPRERDLPVGPLSVFLLMLRIPADLQALYPEFTDIVDMMVSGFLLFIIVYYSQYYYLCHSL
jgi:hypothetical protein